MTYNFDPEKWYRNELSVLKSDLRSGNIDAGEFDSAVEALDRRYDEMLDRLDGSFQLPPG
jgi:hypothetical protein